MILDSFRTHTLIFQIQYANAYRLWDQAGSIATRLCKIWPGMEFKEAGPNRQTFVGDRVVAQLGIDTAVVTLKGEKVFDPRKILQLKETFETLCATLDLETLSRVSTRVQYSKEFPSMKEANAALFAMNLAPWPNTKVFDQPTDGDFNGLEIAYRFEDSESFSVLRVQADRLKAEVKLDPEIFDEHNIVKEKRRLVIDFDRGLLASIPTKKFLVDEWMKGYQHLLHRDIEKVLRVKA